MGDNIKCNNIGTYISKGEIGPIDIITEVGEGKY